MLVIVSSLSSDWPFLMKDLQALFFFWMKMLIDCIIQGAWQDLTVIILLGIKFEKIQYNFIQFLNLLVRHQISNKASLQGNISVPFIIAMTFALS